MKEGKFIFRFYNPNSAEETAEIFLTAMVAANTKKIEEEILYNLEKEKTRRARKSPAISAVI
ncbi:MAG: hypothetical protein IJW21_04545 [Clostridia bacterium]|nr:hypothetical protein [Clostridia bacterium]